MNMLRAVLVGCTVFFMAWYAFSEERMYLPDVPSTKRGTEDVRCANTEQWRDILLLANEYVRLYELNKVAEGTMSDYSILTATYDQRVKNLKDEVSFLKTERDYLRARVEDERKYNLQLDKDFKHYASGWKVTAGVELAAIIALSITSSVLASQR
jgi:hypothetical protein